ncbi:MAG: cobalt ECF transporter T component CbiQ [Proteobacteria bacterium]|nr:cobalt ECF transporter T component CbiQ [Pseudomonadota bacterium]
MGGIENGFLEIGRLDTLAAGDSALHRLDPRAKLLATLVFIVTVVSFDKYTVSGLAPFFLYPFVLVSAGGLPAGFLFKKLLWVAPFALFIGIANPFLDRDVLIHLGPLGISGGWVSFCSIMMRFFLTVSAALILIALTGFNSVCMALEKLGTPAPFVVQLLFLYRYLFVLVEEAARMVRARALRSFSGRTMPFKTFAPLVGQLLLRTLDRAQRIHLAMRCRGFDGRVRVLSPLKFGGAELAFAAGWSAYFLVMRFFDLPHVLGILVTEIMG